MVVMYPTNFPRVTDELMLFVNRVNEQSNGELVIKVVGGPEAIGIFQQGLAVSRGVVDMTWVFSNSYEAIAPYPHKTFLLSLISPEEERKRGVWDMVREFHAKAGLYFLGRGENVGIFTAFHLALTEPVKTPYEIAGKHMRVEFAGRDFLTKGLGTTVTHIDEAELHTALERGLVQGFLNPIDEIYSYATYEVAPYIIDQTVMTGNIVLVMNLEKWNSLPKHLQDLLHEVRLGLEPEWGKIVSKIKSDAKQAVRDGGGTFIKFNEADAAWFEKTYFDTEWASDLEKYPELGPKMKALVTP